MRTTPSITPRCDTTAARRTPAAAAQRLGRRPALDGLRAIAVLVVICLHLGLLDGGYIGVDVFFALSGFLITALLSEEWDQHGKIRLRRFYERRLLRLLPALVLVVFLFAALVLVLDPFNGLWPLGTLIATTLLAANNWVTALHPSHGQVLGALVPTWTLAQEVQFYLLWPACLWIALRRGTKPKTAVAALGVAVLLLLGLAEFVRHAYPTYNSYTSPLDRGAELLLGSAAAIAWRHRLVHRALHRPTVGWLAIAGLAFVLYEGTTPHRGWYLSAAVFAAVLIVNLLARDHSPSQAAISKVLGARPLRYAGKISYGIYLYHLPIYYLLWTFDPGRSRYFYAAIVLSTSFAAAAASWKLVEAPVLRGGLRLPRWRASAPSRLAFRG